MVPRTLIMNAVFKFSYIDKIISLGCADEMGVIFPERGGGGASRTKFACAYTAPGFLTLGLRSIAMLELREGKHLHELNGVQFYDLDWNLCVPL